VATRECKCHQQGSEKMKTTMQQNPAAHLTYVERLKDDLDHTRFEVAETIELIDVIRGRVCETPRLAKAALDMIKGKLFVALDDYNT
jgi:hypothetical protein